MLIVDAYIVSYYKPGYQLAVFRQRFSHTNLKIAPLKKSSGSNLGKTRGIFAKFQVKSLRV